MNKVDPTKKTQFTMEVATDTVEFLNVKLKFDKESKQIYVDVFAKDTDSFSPVEMKKIIGGGGGRGGGGLPFMKYCRPP